eukprot:TRINITY_DN23684_c0_g3_i1.p1 TRINITY_DN23684_c0_g3~~TRINITY_DN23684_c0_g3_i1.p1  ORF type:complete len:668 (+),score=96.17 TRINITY_DN23684_c0_g3_i1:216-2219(+)
MEHQRWPGRSGPPSPGATLPVPCQVSDHGGCAGQWPAGYKVGQPQPLRPLPRTFQAIPSPLSPPSPSSPGKRWTSDIIFPPATPVAPSSSSRGSPATPDARSGGAGGGACAPHSAGGSCTSGSFGQDASPPSPWMQPTSPPMCSGPRSASNSPKCSPMYSRCGPLGERFAALLGDATLAERLVASPLADQPPGALMALLSLAEQAVFMSIDYRTLRLGWHHPGSRSEYRLGRHGSIACSASRRRGAETRRRITECLVPRVLSGDVVAGDALVEAFLFEIGLPADASAIRSAASFEGVAAALEAELLLPLRALLEGEINRTLYGAPLPESEIRAVVFSIVEAVVSGVGNFAAWRYGCPAGVRQLQGLSEAQLRLWRDPFDMVHEEPVSDGAGSSNLLVRTHEDGPGELGFFWATKIGGPSHGFDIEAQCILPLLANARHKVILLSDPRWPDHPAGRAHWRLLFALRDAVVPSEAAPAAGADDSATAASENAQAAASGPDESLPAAAADTHSPPQPAAPCGAFRELGPRLWLEAVNCDFAAAQVAGLDAEAMLAPVLRHAVAKADAMGVPLSVHECDAEALHRVLAERQERELARGQGHADGRGMDVRQVRERYLLRASNAVVEASDYLSELHDWVQTSDEVTQPIPRFLYVPYSFRRPLRPLPPLQPS